MHAYFFLSIYELLHSEYMQSNMYIFKCYILASELPNKNMLVDINFQITAKYRAFTVYPMKCFCLIIVLCMFTVNVKITSLFQVNIFFRLRSLVSVSIKNL